MLTKKNDTLNKKLKYVDCVDTKEDITADILRYRNNIKNEKIKLKKIEINIKKNEQKHFDIILPNNILNDIKNYFRNTVIDEINDVVNELFYSLIQVNIDIVSNIHNEKLSLINQKNTIEKQIQSFNSELSDTKRRLNDFKKYEKIIKNNTQVKNEISNNNLIIKKENQNIKSLEYELCEIEQIKQSFVTKEMYDEATKKYKEFKCDLKILEIYLNIININCFPISIFKLLCTQLEKHVNIVLNSFLCCFSVEIIFDHKKSNVVMATIDIYQICSSNKLHVLYCSTSEKNFINLAFKIALKKIVNISLPSFLIIDEHFENIDSGGLYNLDKIIETINSSYDNIFIISHLYQISQICNKIININKINNFSTIKQ